uniref:SAM domain-containing protein n=1 Tax=Nothoprocta perdicaria TaxID=30464 RepID=A0A8C6ZMZ9_NOTPE
MEPVGAWSPTRVAAWFRGLDAVVQGYPFEAWALPGAELLRLSAAALEALGVWRLGHQELLLEAVEQLRALVSVPRAAGPAPGTGLARGGRRAGAAPRPPSLELLACVAELLGAAKGLFSWLNRSGPGRGQRSVLRGTHACWVSLLPRPDPCCPCPSLQVPLLHPERLLGQPRHRLPLRGAGGGAAGGERWAAVLP